MSLMATVTKNGNSITLWDLNKQKVYSILQDPHHGRSITHLDFMPNEPILVTSSDDDNSLKMWIFEKGLIQPRFLKER